MTSLRRFYTVLQEEVHVNDKIWKYNVSNLPSTSSLNAARLIKSVSLTSSSTKQCISLRLEPVPVNRVSQSEVASDLMLLSCADFKLRLPSSSVDDKVQFAPAKDSAEYLVRLLVTGIELNGTKYNFFGHSNSQLKSRSCVLLAASKERIAVKIEAMGDFSTLKSASKKAKRIGLLFSSADVAVDLPADRCEDIADIKTDDYLYTDGCGLISPHLSNQIAQRRQIVFRNKRYRPSVYQIRYRGYKGVLMLEPSLQGQIQVKFRDSMRKFRTDMDMGLAVVDYSKPYSFGHLNDEIVLLLYALGVSTETLLRKQVEHIQLLESVKHGDVQAAFQFLCYIDQINLAERLLLNGIADIQATLNSLVKDQFTKMLTKRDEQRCRVLIAKSRLLFGVCDPGSPAGGLGVLKPGTCFVRITSTEDGQARTLVDTEVLVTRNPCLHPGDLQKFRVVNVPQFAHLVDCIVFPTCGRRPSADLMSGGDLDGDKFFVTWDPDIIPTIIAQPAEYPGVKEPISFKPVTDEDRAIYFARYTNASLGRVKNLYLKWARLKGAMSAECQQLNRLFSQCVDGNRIKVPVHLEDPKEPACATDFVLDVMHNVAKDAILKIQNNEGHTSGESYDSLETLLNCDSLAMSEFSLFQLTTKWCRRNHAELGDFNHFFDYSRFNDEQRAWAIGHFPKAEHVPSLIFNGLTQSHIVDPREISRFGLHHHAMHWQPVFRSHVDRMGRFMTSACQSLELFHKKLIIIQADERLTLMVYIPHKIEKATEVQVDNRVRVFALPRSQGYESIRYRVMPTKVNYRIYCDDAVFQLYELKRGNTFIFLTRGAMDDTTFRSIQGRGDRRRQQQRTIDEGTNFNCRASVALDKISKNIQNHVGKMNRAGILAAEIYVISNRDVQSMQLLDQWLHYIDTEEELPLFETIAREYNIPTLKSVDWQEAGDLATRVLRDKDLDRLRRITSSDSIATLFDLLYDHEEHSEVRHLYNHILTEAAEGRFSISRHDIACCLLRYLPKAPYLAMLFFRSGLWESSQEELREEVLAIAADLLMKLVLNLNEMAASCRAAMRLVLAAMRQIRIQELADLVELIALAVRDPEVAIDVLLGCIEPQISRLVVGRLPENQQLAKSLIGIALDHIDECASTMKATEELLRLSACDHSDGYAVVKCTLRIDAPSGYLKIGDHIRLSTASKPQNDPISRVYCVDALVISSQSGSVSFRCLHRLPSFFAECDWKLSLCGSFVTSKTMIEAVIAFHGRKEIACALYTELVGRKSLETPGSAAREMEADTSVSHRLNEGQHRALRAAMMHPLTLLWGPPGTGKTHTIVEILEQLLHKFATYRFLVTAPTHNAVDNLLQRFIADDGPRKTAVEPVRVSTAVSKVASSLRKYTCDAMVGKDLGADFAGRRAAQKRVKQSRLIFTTCAGAGLGLLRSERFEVVVIDEASQLTEATSLVPLVKGCQRAILVGDHVQLRATVQQHAVIVDYDVSLFERLYTLPFTTPRSRVAKVMLDTQYRMHSDICKFPSNEFYEGRLKTGDNVDTSNLSLTSRFPWPERQSQHPVQRQKHGVGNQVERQSRTVFVQCSTPEDVGNKSKANRGQVELCRRICDLLDTPAAPQAQPPPPASNVEGQGTPTTQIAILTPYTRQRDLLDKINHPPASSVNKTEYTTSSIDAFQGREADIVILVTVRCNPHHETGFLKDLRRLNVAITRAKRGVIVIGDRATLTGQLSQSMRRGTDHIREGENGSIGMGTTGNDTEREQEQEKEIETDIHSKQVWKRLLDHCTQVDIDIDV